MTALITGGSKGIGFALAEELAKRKFNVFLISRSEGELQQACKTLSEKYGVKAWYLAVDLSLADAPEKIVDYIRAQNLSINVLINNAGFALWGSFEELTFEEQQRMLMVNVVNLLKLTHLLLPALKKQTKAYILNVASTTAYQAMANFSVYSSSKAFVVSFTRALKYELRNSTVSVSCLSPGTTTSNFMNRAGMTTERMQKQSAKVTMEPSVVAAQAINGMFKGKAEIIPGFLNRFSVFMIRLVPKWLPEKIAADLYKKV